MNHGPRGSFEIVFRESLNVIAGCCWKVSRAWNSEPLVGTSKEYPLESNAELLPMATRAFRLWLKGPAWRVQYV